MSILDFEGYVDDNEGDIDDKNEVIEQLWEKQQKTTFTAWCNSHLRKVGTSIEDINEDFKDGLKLMKLIEVISGDSLPKPDRGKMRVHKITNVSKCLKFIQDKGVHLVSIGPEEIVDGNIKMTLGMIWTIILRFAIQDIQMEDMSAKEGLLLWCQRKTSPYKNVRVNNFHMSFKDGLAFCALIHRHRPELINYKDLSKENPADNLKLAFEVAEKHLDIPQMLDIEDMVNNVKPDELSVMAYVSSYYHAFSGAHKAETASNRICKVINVNRENELMINHYDEKASDLLKWTNDKIEYLDNGRMGSTPSMAEMNSLSDVFRSYRREEKPPRQEEKGQLESDYNTLQTRLRLSSRPAFVPRDGAYVSDINRRWRDLEQSEKDYEDWLMSEIKRRERLDHLVKNFHVRCNTHEAWTRGKVDMLRSEDFRQSNVADLRAFQKRQEAFESDLVGHDTRVHRIREIASELRNLNYEDMAAIDSRLDPISDTWKLMQQLTEQKKEEIRKLHSLLEEIDQLQLEYAKQVAPFYNWMEQSKEDLQDSHMLHHIDEVKSLMEEQTRFNASLGEAESQFGMLDKMDSTIRQLATDNQLSQISENPYTILTQTAVQSEWRELCGLMPVRDEFLRQELSRQTENEALRQQFVVAANELGPWVEARLEAVHSLWMATEDDQAHAPLSLEQQKQRLLAIEKELEVAKPLAQQVDKYSQELHSKLIFDTPQSRYSMETLRVSWEQLQSAVRRAGGELDNQILTRDSRGISKTQMDEFVRCFNHFDKNHSRTLEPNEFRACLVSLGHNIRDERKSTTKLARRPSIGETDFLAVMTQADPAGCGVVTFEAFIDYMARETTEQDTMEQIVQSFRTLAQDKDYISAEELRRELPADQAEYCISQMVPYGDGSHGDDALDYKLFASSLYGSSDL